jgi:pimeloyl-ACP methyl ester carboxylesterase
MWSGLNEYRWGPTMETRRIEITPGMTFDVSVDGIDAAPLVLMLHGFGVSCFFWNSQVRALGEAGYFAVAPNQRGYAAGARPDPTDYASYRVDRLIGDALDIVAAVGHGDRRLHLVGHDWGASLAWQIADQHPERLLSLTILSRPHPLAFARALQLPDGEQRRRSARRTAGRSSLRVSGTAGGDCRLDLSQLGAVARLLGPACPVAGAFHRTRAREVAVTHHPRNARLRCLLQASSVPASLTTEL